MNGFGEAQPGDTYHYSPLTVNNLGIIDCYNDTLIAYVYHEGAGKKVGSNVTSLTLENLRFLGWIDDSNVPPSKDGKLNIMYLTTAINKIKITW